MCRLINQNNYSFVFNHFMCCISGMFFCTYRYQIIFYIMFYIRYNSNIKSLIHTWQLLVKLQYVQIIGPTSKSHGFVRCDLYFSKKLGSRPKLILRFLWARPFQVLNFVVVSYLSTICAIYVRECGVILYKIGSPVYLVS